MKIKTIQYGLRHKIKKTLLKVQATSNESASLCVSVAYELVDWSDNPVWLVESPEHAEFVRQHSTPWYNASYDTPINSYDSDGLQVVKVISEVEEEEVCVNIPSFEQLMRHKYKREGGKYYNPQHYIYVMNEFKKSIGTKKEEEFHYDLYDLHEYISDNEKEVKVVGEKLKQILAEEGI